MVSGKAEEVEYKGHRYDDQMYDVLKEFKHNDILKGLKKKDFCSRKKAFAI